MRVAIMQPTYLPWSGYFGLMQAVDLFIFLDSVQFAKRSWQQRNQIKTPLGAQWLTVPVLSKGKQDQLITSVEINLDSGFPSDHQKAIEIHYRKTKYYETYAPRLFAWLASPSRKLVDITMGLILEIKDFLGIPTRTLRASQLGSLGAKAELLASLCREVRASEYISPPGSKEYLAESDAFEKSGIQIKYFDFRHPQYPQLYGPFLPFMSSIDLIFNCGPESTEIIRAASIVAK